jgi:hypothetical protein
MPLWSSLLVKEPDAGVRPQRRPGATHAVRGRELIASLVGMSGATAAEHIGPERARNAEKTSKLGLRARKRARPHEVNTREAPGNLRALEDLNLWPSDS